MPGWGLWGKGGGLGTNLDEEFVWTPPTAPDDKSPVVYDGSEHLWIYKSDTRPSLTYETRDTRRVIRSATVPSINSDFMVWNPKGPAFPRTVFEGYGWEWRVSFYLDTATAQLQLSEGPGWSVVRPWADLRGLPSGDYDGAITDPTDGFSSPLQASPPNMASWGSAEWVTLGIRLDTDGKVYGLIKKEADADNWVVLHPGIWPPMGFPMLSPHPTSLRFYPEDAGSVVDFWKYEWRRI